MSKKFYIIFAVVLCVIFSLSVWTYLKWTETDDVGNNVTYTENEHTSDDIMEPTPEPAPEIVVVPVTEETVIEEVTESAVGLNPPTVTESIPQVVYESDAWKRYMNSSYYTEDFTIHPYADDWILGEAKVDDFKISFEYCQGRTYIEVIGDDQYNPVEVFVTEPD